MTIRRLRIGQIGTDQTIAFAVQELSRYVKQMDPALFVEILTVPAADASFADVLWVGQDASFAVSESSDTIAIAVDGMSGFISGSNPRSVLIAVYRFLRHLGCIWVRPGSEGEHIPAKEVTGTTLHVTETASYRHRGVCIEGANSYENIRDMIDFLPKVGMNEYFIQFLVPVEFFQSWYAHPDSPCLTGTGVTRQDVAAMVRSLEAEIRLRGLLLQRGGHGWTCEPFGVESIGWNQVDDETLSDEYKSYLAEVNGERKLWRGRPTDTNLCYSNPKARDRLTDGILKFCKDNPTMSAAHFWLGDAANNQCECDACKTKRPSDWYVMMLNELDAKLTREGLSTKIVFLLYFDLLWEPAEEKILNPDRFILMFAPITRNYGENYDDFLVYDKELPPYVRNALILPKSLHQNLAQLRRWQQIFDGDSFDFDYHLMWAHMNDPGYEASARNIHADMRALETIHLDGMVSCQIQRSFFPTALPFQVMAATLWDRTCDYDTVADRYYQDAFGKDGACLRKQMQTVSDLMLLYNGPAFGAADHADGPFCKDYDALADAIAALRALAQAHHGENADWTYLTCYCDYLDLLLPAFKLLEQGKKEESRAAGEALLDFVRRNELALQPVLDMLNTCRVLKRRLQMES